MGDITSLKVRLARLRLAGSKSKEISERIRNRRKPIEEEEEPQTRKATKDPGYAEYTKNTGGKRKKVNKLTRSDQKRGKKVPEATGRGTIHERNLPGSRGEKARREYAEFKKNTLDKMPDFDYEGYVKKNKLTRSDQKRP